MFQRICLTIRTIAPRKVAGTAFFTKTTAKCISSHAVGENKSNKFGQEEINRVLDIINTKSGRQLASYDISKAKLTKLEAWKLKNGNFQTLDDVLRVDGFSTKILDKFCKSLLSDMPVKRSPRKTAPFVTPPISEGRIEEISSCVSVSVGVSSIFWSRLELNKDAPCHLTHWQHHDINDKKLHLHDLIHRCLYIDYLLPHADCYVFENPQIAVSTTPGNAEQVNINVQRAQLMAILGFALANRNTSDQRSKTNVCYLKKFLAARLFQHLVGTERVSSEETILGLMRTHFNVDDMTDTDEKPIGGQSSRGNVSFPSELRSMFNEAERYHREFLGQTLLLNLAFVRLVLLRDEQARMLVSRSNKVSEVE